MALIELRNVSKVYDLGEVQVEALRHVTLSIEQGEYVALMGPSGSGKSTLMNTLGCLDRPTSGSYLLAGQEVVTMSRDQRARIRNEKVGFVFQNFNLLARGTAVENVELPMLYARGMSARRRRLRAIQLLDQVKLAGRRDHHPSQLSGGEQQRVAIARALANEPAIILADEPTGNLDSKTSKEVLKLFEQLNDKSGLTVILVTHDIQVAQQARRRIALHDGEIVHDTIDMPQTIQSIQTEQFLGPQERNPAPHAKS